MSETYKKELVQHVIRNLLDTQLLRILQAQPTWGYKIKKQVKTARAIAHTISEAEKLVHSGFEYVTDSNGAKLFRKRKRSKLIFH